MATTTGIEDRVPLQSGVSKTRAETGFLAGSGQAKGVLHRSGNGAAPRFLAGADMMLIALLGCAATLWRFHLSWSEFWKPRDSVPVQHHLVFLTCYCVVFLLIGSARGLYQFPHGRSVGAQLMELTKTMLWVSPIQMSLIYLSGEKTISRMVIAITTIGSLPLLLLWRSALHRWTLAGVSGLRNVLIVGAGKEGQMLRARFETNPQLGLRCLGFVDRCVAGRASDCDEHSPVLGGVEDLETIIKQKFVDEVLITLPEDRMMVREVAIRASNAGADVRVVPDLYDGFALGATVDYLGDLPTITLHQRTVPILQLAIKRMIDVIAASLALAVISPLYLLIMMAIKLDSRGPVFFNSVRIGRKGKPFTCHKFRTMVSNAEELRQSVEHLNERHGILFKIADDPRKTRVGYFLRKYSLDELPQAWNVLKGDMSLVGPRPPIPGEFSQYAIDHFRRLDVVPGITGLWQVEARQNPSFEDYIRLDLYYVENWSLWLDIKLILRTVRVVLAGTGR